MTKLQFVVTGMHCKSCKMLVEDELQELGAKDIFVSVDEKKQQGIVSCDYNGDIKKVYAGIKKAGYNVKE